MKHLDFRGLSCIRRLRTRARDQLVDRECCQNGRAHVGIASLDNALSIILTSDLHVSDHQHRTRMPRSPLHTAFVSGVKMHGPSGVLACSPAMILCAATTPRNAVKFVFVA